MWQKLLLSFRCSFGGIPSRLREEEIIAGLFLTVYIYKIGFYWRVNICLFLFKTSLFHCYKIIDNTLLCSYIKMTKSAKWFKNSRLSKNKPDIISHVIFFPFYIYYLQVLFIIQYISPHMGYNKFIQVGRVARINYGPLEGKLATIVDIINDKRVLVDGQDIQRQVIPIRRLQLTSQVVKIGRGARTGKLRAAISKDNVAKKYAESTVGKSFARQQRRQNLTDFERYKVLVLRRKLAKLTRAKPSKKWFLFKYLNHCKYICLQLKHKILFVRMKLWFYYF